MYFLIIFLLSFVSKNHRFSSYFDDSAGELSLGSDIVRCAAAHSFNPSSDLSFGRSSDSSDFEKMCRYLCLSVRNQVKSMAPEQRWFNMISTPENSDLILAIDTYRRANTNILSGLDTSQSRRDDPSSFLDDVSLIQSFILRDLSDLSGELFPQIESWHHTFKDLRDFSDIKSILNNFNNVDFRNLPNFLQTFNKQRDILTKFADRLESDLRFLSPKRRGNFRVKLIRLVSMIDNLTAVKKISV